jgi:hypothetical protein
MPAYRSSDEGEIREAVVAHLLTLRPSARIIHELNCSTYGPNRIDVRAVTPAEILAVEINSQKDKLDRLPAQIAACGLVPTIPSRRFTRSYCGLWAAPISTWVS